jgi:hypothetical protein
VGYWQSQYTVPASSLLSNFAAERRRHNVQCASCTTWGDMYTTILAYVIAFLGFVMIGTGVWGLYYLLRGPEAIPLRYVAMIIAMICGGFGFGGYCTRPARVGRDCARNTAVLKFVVGQSRPRHLRRGE